MFGFIKKPFLVGLTVLSYVNPLSTNQLSATPLGCISMTIKEYKVSIKLLMLIVISLYCILLVLKQVNAAVVVTILTVVVTVVTMLKYLI